MTSYLFNKTNAFFSVWTGNGSHCEIITAAGIAEPVAEGCNTLDMMRSRLAQQSTFQVSASNLIQFLTVLLFLGMKLPHEITVVMRNLKVSLIWLHSFCIQVKGRKVTLPSVTLWNINSLFKYKHLNSLGLRPRVPKWRSVELRESWLILQTSFQYFNAESYYVLLR